MVAKADPTWNDWRRHIFGDPYLVWHDGPDFQSLVAAHRDDREQVDRMLLAGVAERDSLAAESIGRLEPEMPVPQALAALIAANVPASGEFALQRARTLLALTGNAAHRDTMLTILGGGDHWGVRINAAIAISRLAPTAEAIDALQHAAADEEYLVRYHSANALLRYAGDSSEIAGHRLFGDLATPPNGETATDAHRRAWAHAAQELASEARAVLKARET